MRLARSLVALGLAALAIIWRRPRSWRVMAAATLGVSLAIAATLQFIKVDFYFGDNPGSRFYNLDLVRNLGIRFFWTVNTDYWESTTADLSLPETLSSTGRAST